MEKNVFIYEMSTTHLYSFVPKSSILIGIRKFKISTSLEQKKKISTSHGFANIEYISAVANRVHDLGSMHSKT